MKTAFFAAALLGAFAVQGVKLEQETYDLAEILAEIEGQGQGQASAEVLECMSSQCKENVNGINIVLKTPDCKAEEKQCEKTTYKPFNEAIVGALGEISGNSTKLAEALQRQFDKTKELADSKVIKVSGCLGFEQTGMHDPVEYCDAANCDACGQKKPHSCDDCKMRKCVCKREMM